MNSIFSKNKKSLHFFNKYGFSIHSNFRHKMRYYLEKKEIKLDYNIHLYDRQIQAYLEKRWTKKSEIEPKIYVIKPLQSIAETLKTQKTVNFTQLLDNDRLNKIFKTESIDTKYIMSICLEPYFKAVLDQYLQKVLVNGRTIPLNDLKKYEVIKKKVLNLFRMFFYGDQITLYERQIEKKYLAEKQKKWYRYLNRKISINKCVWTFNDQNCLEGLRNWRARNLNIYDDFRPLFDNLPELQNKSFEKQNLLKFFQRKQNTNEYHYIASILLSRTISYCSSVELISNLRVPPDYRIEICIINFHISLIISRLRIFKNEASIEIIKHLENEFNRFIKNKSVKFTLSKKVLNVFETCNYLAIFRKTSLEFLNLDFINHDDNQILLMKLLNFNVFLEKPEIKSDDIKLFCHYTISQFKYLLSLDFQNIISGIEWDFYKIPLDISEKKEFEKLEGWGKFQKQMQVIKDFDNSSMSDVVVGRFYRYIFDVMRKFITLSTYDYFNDREEKEKIIKQKQSKYFWKVK